ncbi:XRE family transcriptional regulator [Bradyrhizobium sp. ISRA443]|uniref:helix-turn-helix domain-containing protein n=1 Tax=unclassified Bradyrhizobium TaxID=2631580 RepID=UPI00247A0CE9|nr:MULTISPECIES: XRE family transcriptional regulator [unclassified Bradyrhizobium]WGR93462.1 XRE family transcriptional regulator [Bradyrhizobium sp. ISRA435]WGR98012.1 XRE family transcriptional regulator [Bradyrhizobium sp. ISRA436]WGS04901.1 XRE family transcriptional regulator [Bradyrhizobium sp. ISRA437]WGS11785.1 XRE family transcriptional regulator [Bradyrhizobium sp. ISRA443]
MSKVKRADHKRRGNVKKGRAPEQAPAPAETAVAKPPIDERTGAAIRRARVERGLTLSDVASAASISVPMLSRFETGQSTASLVLLERICAVLGTDLPTLFSEIEQARGEAQLIKASDQMEVVRSGTKHGHTYRLLSYHKGPRKLFEPFLINMDKESESYPRFQHPGTEFIYMLSGRMEYRFGDRTFLVEPGDAFTFSGGVLHGPEKLLDDRIQFITIIIYAE